MINGGLRTRGIIKKSTTDKPLISVVTVVFNGAKTLEQTIQSVVNQTYDNIEYIIIDGNSTDGTLDIIKKYEDKIDYWQSEPDNGIYDAMNKGIKLASGEWINFMNAGDMFFSDSVLKNIFYKKKEYEKVDVIYGDVCINDTIVKPRKLYSFSYTLPFCHQASFTRIFNDMQYSVKYKIISDYIFYKELYRNKAKFFYVNSPVSFFDASGISSNWDLLMKEKVSYAVTNKNIKDILLLELLLFKNKFLG